MANDTYPAAVVAAVLRHMNDDHAAEALVMCRGLGGQPGATAARVTGLDAAGLDLVAEVAGESVPVKLPWGRPPTDRAQIRAEVVRLYEEACHALGIPPGHPA